MARIRTIKPEFFRHEALYELEQETGYPIRVAYAGLFCCADREGRFEWRPRQLKLDVLPWDEVDFEAVLSALANEGFIEQYEADGKVFAHIPSWSDHQAVNAREAQSKLPSPNSREVHVHAREEHVSANVPANTRDLVFERDDHKCVRCGATNDLTIDHIFPRSIGGNHALTNLRTLCRPCNSARPVAGKALVRDLEKDGLTLNDMERTCMHVHYNGEGNGKGKEGEREREGEKETRSLSGKPDPAKKNLLSMDEVREVFEHWQTVCDHPKAVLADERIRIIRRAGKHYPVAALKKAIDGCAVTPHNQGVNDRGEKYDSIDLILRDSEHVERFCRNADNPPTQVRRVNGKGERFVIDGEEVWLPQGIEANDKEILALARRFRVKTQGASRSALQDKLRKKLERAEQGELA